MSTSLTSKLLENKPAHLYRLFLPLSGGMQASFRTLTRGKLSPNDYPWANSQEQMAGDADFYSFLTLSLREPWLFFSLKDWWSLRNTETCGERWPAPMGACLGKVSRYQSAVPTWLKTGSLAFWGNWYKSPHSQTQ